MKKIIKTIKSAIKLTKKKTGIELDPSIFTPDISGSYSYYSGGRIYLCKDVDLMIVLHEIGHFIYRKYLKENPELLEVFHKPTIISYVIRPLYDNGVIKYDKESYLSSTAAINGEEDFCECFAEVVSGDSEMTSYTKTVRNKIRRVEKLLRGL